MGRDDSSRRYLLYSLICENIYKRICYLDLNYLSIPFLSCSLIHIRDPKLVIAVTAYVPAKKDHQQVEWWTQIRTLLLRSVFGFYISLQRDKRGPIWHISGSSFNEYTSQLYTRVFTEEPISVILMSIGIVSYVWSVSTHGQIHRANGWNMGDTRNTVP